MYNNVAFIVCPSQELERPPAAAAALAGVMRNNNVNYKIYDLNLSVYHALNKQDWLQCERKWRVDQKLDLPDSFEVWFSKTINDIVTGQHDLIALSVFTKFSTRFAELLIKRLRPLVSIPIISGGQGLTTPYNDKTFGHMLYDEKLIDYVTTGDGEVVFDSFLKGIKKCPGLNWEPTEQILDLNSIPYPVFDQIDPQKYIYHCDAGIYVTASRGCVRKCKFCDVPSRWPKYRYRCGRDVAKEIYTQFKNHRVQVVQFTDSVINGVLLEFENLLDELIKYKQQDTTFKPSWLSQFNIRKQQDMPERFYDKMSRSGAGVLVCGVEHASWRIREAMGKEFNNEDLDHHIRMCAKYGIANVFLMFIGYPTETALDHQEMLRFLEKYQVYMLAGTIMVVRWGYTGSLDHGSRLELQQDKMSIVPEWPDLKIMTVDDQVQDWIYGRNWINLNNPSLTFKERIRRRLEVQEYSNKLGYPITRSREELEILKIICKAYYQNKTPSEKIQELSDH
jgi:radical SAM superfamily enzyme YgiQ (UPF0313 family)